VWTAKGKSDGGNIMLWTIGAALVFLWVLGFTTHVGGSLIHLLLVIGVAVLVWHFLTGRRTA
jgi:uncharacterized protein DUF5670